MSAPSILVVVVAYQSGDYLQTCIDALAVQTLPDFTCVIADNASTDESVGRLRLPDARFRVEAMGGNLGFAAANNRVALASSADWIATLNPDAVPQPSWLEALIAGASRWSAAASFGSTQLMLETPERLDGVGDVWHAAGAAWRARHGRPASLIPPEGETFAACAAAALYRGDAFRAAGGFDESYFCYSEDVDLGYRFRLAGHIAVQIPSAVVMHAGSAISGRTSDFTIFHGHRNRVWTFLKCTPGPLLPLLLPYHLAMNALLLLLLLRVRSPGPLVRAYAAAVRGLPHVLAVRRRVQASRRTSLRSLIDAMAWSPLSLLRRDVRGGRLPFRKSAIRALEASLAATPPSDD